MPGVSRQRSVYNLRYIPEASWQKYVRPYNWDWHKYKVYCGIAVFHCDSALWFNTYSPVVSRDRYMAILPYNRDQLSYSTKYMVYYGTAGFHCSAGMWFNTHTVQLSYATDTWVYYSMSHVSHSKDMCVFYGIHQRPQGKNTWDPIIETSWLTAQIHGVLQYSWIPLRRR